MWLLRSATWQINRNTDRVSFPTELPCCWRLWPRNLQSEDLPPLFQQPAGSKCVSKSQQVVLRLVFMLAQVSHLLTHLSQKIICQTRHTLSKPETRSDDVIPSWWKKAPVNICPFVFYLSLSHEFIFYSALSFVFFDCARPKSQLIGRRLERPAVLARSRCMMDRRVTLLFTQLLGHIVHSLKYYFSNTYAVPIPLEFIYFKKAHHNFPKTQKQFYVCSNHQSQLKDIQWHYCVEKKLKIIVTKIFT